MDEVKEGVSPCLLVIQKRLRAQKKKLARITELEGLQSQGKELTPEQVRANPPVGPVPRAPKGAHCPRRPACPLPDSQCHGSQVQEATEYP